MTKAVLQKAKPHDFTVEAAAIAASVIAMITMLVLLIAVPVLQHLHRWDWHLDALATISRSGFVDGLLQRSMLATACIALAALVAGIGAHRLTDAQDPAPNLIDGDARLFRGSHARVRLAQFFAKANGADARGGLWLAPHIRLPFGDEVGNIFISGNQKSGKSTLMRALVEQCVERGDRVFIHSFKEEFSEAFGRDDAILIAPHLATGWAWDVAGDVLNVQDVREFAGRVIPSSDNPFWSLAARAVMTDIMTSMMREKPRSWTWIDLALAMFKTPTEILAILEKIRFGAKPLFLTDEDGNPNNTTHGILATMIAAVLNTIVPLALAWEHVPPARRFSIRSWLLDPSPRHRVVIFQSAGAYPQLTQLVGGGLIEAIRGVMTTEMRDSRTRRVVLALDELNELGTLPGFDRMVATCRSRGLVLICATQSIGQLRKLYGDDAETIRQLFRWQIVSKVPQGKPGDDMAATVMSKRKIVWHEKIDGQKDLVRHEEERYPVMPARMERDLGLTTNAKGEKIARMILTGAGDVYELEIPETKWAVRRKNFEPADWTKPIGNG